LECLGYMECHKYIDGNLFVNFIEKVFELLGDDLVNFKKVINSMTGLLNKKWKCDENGFITIDEDLVNTCIFEGYKIEFEGYKDKTYIVKNKNKRRINGDTCIVYYIIILSGI